MLNQCRVPSGQPFSSWVIRLLVVGVALVISGCAVNQSGDDLATTSSGTTASNTIPTTTETVTDDAPGQCTRLAVGSPTRNICTNCYNSVLTSRCPGKIDPADCVDTSVTANFTNLVNQCISQTTLAGFVCNTSCAAGWSLNPTNCACVAASSSGGSSGSGGSGGGSSGGSVDSGQTNYGPPVVIAQWPGNSIIATVTGSPVVGSPVAGSTIPACGTAASSTPTQVPIWFSVQNRGDTVPRLNSYGSPEIGIAPATAVNASSYSILDAITTPASPSTAMSVPGGVNAYTTFSFRSGGEQELFASSKNSFSYPGRFKQFSGTPGISFAIPATSSIPNTARQFGWEWPGFGTRDRFGNIYFADMGRNGGSIRVVCNYLAASANNPWCQGQAAAGLVVKIAGGDGADDHGKTAGSDWASGAHNGCGAAFDTVAGVRHGPRFGRLGGLAVDDHANVFFADTSRSLIGVVCAGASGYCSGGGLGLVGGTYVVAGTADTQDVSLTPPATAKAATRLANPLGIDVTEDPAGTGAINLYVAEAGANYAEEIHYYPGMPTPMPTPLPATDMTKTGRIRAICGYADTGTGPCKGTYPVGHPGFPFSYSVDSGLDLAADVKINWNHNLVYTERGDHNAVGRVIARCFDKTKSDFCLGATLPVGGAAGSGAKITLAGGASFGDSGDGGAATSAQLTRPNALLIGKSHATDVGAVPVDALFARDNNVAFTELLYRASNDSTDAVSGNAVRIICGTGPLPVSTPLPSPNPGDEGITTQGICSGHATGTLFKVAGKYGYYSGQNGGTMETLATSAPFVAAYGITYDVYKNIVVSSQAVRLLPTSDANTDVVFDNSLKIVGRTSLTYGTGQAKYSFTDSNQLTSYYCLRTKVLTECYLQDNLINCECEPVAPYGTARTFWEPGSVTYGCSPNE